MRELWWNKIKDMWLKTTHSLTIGYELHIVVRDLLTLSLALAQISSWEKGWLTPNYTIPRVTSHKSLNFASWFIHIINNSASLHDLFDVNNSASPWNRWFKYNVKSLFFVITHLILKSLYLPHTHVSGESVRSKLCLFAVCKKAKKIPQ